MYIPLIFLLLISSFNFISSSAEEYKCKNEDINREIEIGDEVTICLHSKEKKKKIAYKLKVDKYSIITIEGGYNAFKPENTNSQQTRTLSEDSQKSRFRNMIKEPDNNEGEAIPTTSITEPKTTTISHKTSEISTTQVTEPEPDSSEIVENPDDKAKFVAQIGDKMTQYPSVSLFNKIIFLIISFIYIVIFERK